MLTVLVAAALIGTPKIAEPRPWPMWLSAIVSERGKWHGGNGCR